MKIVEEWRKDQERKQRAKDNIPNWIEKGKALIIFPERYADWEKCVLAHTSGYYYGLEVENALEIMTALENGASMEEAKRIFDNQGNSERVASVVRSMLFTFSSRGPEFWEVSAKGEISPENKRIVEAKKQYNALHMQARNVEETGNFIESLSKWDPETASIQEDNTIGGPKL